MSNLQRHGKKLQAKLNARFDALCRESLAVNREDLSKPMAPEAKQAVIDQIRASEHDPYGDGCQDPVPHPSITGQAAVEASDPLRNAWSTGLDMNQAIHTADGSASFHLAAATGDVKDVRNAILEARKAVAGGDQYALVRLLEKRISLMRFTPLHYCCHGARMIVPTKEFVDAGLLCFTQVADMLLAAGARVDSRDLCGYTSLGTAAGFISSPESLNIVPILVKYGANANIRNRFGESLLMHPIWSNSVEAFRALLLAGADVMLADNTGLTPRIMASQSPKLLSIMTEVQRLRLLSEMECDHCGLRGADKFCSACRTAYYCSKECQTRAWRAEHKAKCGKDDTPGSYLDIVVDTMTARDPLPGVRTPTVQFTNSITGATSRRRMRPKEFNTSFIVKVNKAIVLGGIIGAVKINVKNSDYLLVKNRGDGKAAHARLMEVIDDKGIDVGKIYLSAKWLLPGGATSSGKKKVSNVLRIDVSKGLPPPKPLW